MNRDISIAGGPTFSPPFLVYQALIQEAQSSTVVINDQAGLYDTVLSPSASVYLNNLATNGNPSGNYALSNLLSSASGGASRSVYMPTEPRTTYAFPYLTVRVPYNIQDPRTPNIRRFYVSVGAWDSPIAGIASVERINRIVSTLFHNNTIYASNSIQPLFIEVLEEYGPNAVIDYAVYQTVMLRLTLSSP